MDGGAICPNRSLVVISRSLELDMMDTLNGKVTIVTGASSGIGAATARTLSKLGCKLVLAARSSDRIEALSRDLGPEALAVTTDVTAANDVERLVSKTIDRFGKIDVLFANAGVYIPGKVVQGDPEKWANLIDVNITGVMRCVRGVLPHMIAANRGDIIVTSSISGVIDIDWEPIYSASKHAIHGFVHTLRRQVMESGIRVGAIAPGMVANELWGITEESDIRSRVAARTSLRSEDVADAVVFMLSRPPNVTIRDLVMLPQNQDL